MRFVACVFAAAVMGAAAAPALRQGESPLEDGADQYQQFLREKRSSYPNQYYLPPPCASAHAPAYLTPPLHHAAYAPHLGGLHPYGYGLSGLSGLPHYRDADEHEMMSFSDSNMPEQFMAESMMQESMPFARYAPVAAHYGATGLGPAGAVGLGPAGAVAGLSPGPAIGVFPNANTGGCSVPLLLSCSPSIRPGHLVKSQYGYGGDSYRGVEAHPAHEAHEDQPATHEANSEHMPLHQ